MAQQLINIGTTANDGTGDNLRTAFDKINENFTEVFTNAQTAIEVSADTTPQLGGNLDVNGKSIVSTSNGNININPNGTGYVLLDNLRINDRTLSSNVTNTQLVLRGNGTQGVNILNTVINTGTVDNVIIGSTTAAAGTFTDASVTGNLAVTGNVAVTANTALTGNLTVDGVSTFAGNVVCTGSRNRIAGELRIGTDVNSPYTASFGTNIANTLSEMTDSSVRLQLISADNYNTRLLMESIGSGNSILTARHANGTAAAPEAIDAGDVLFRAQVRGYTGTDYSGTQGEIRFVASEDWTNSARGTTIRFFTTRSGTTDLIEGGRFNSNGSLSILNDVNSVDAASGSFITEGGIGVAKDIHGGGDLHVTGNVFAQTNLIINGRAQFEEMEISYNSIEATASNGDIRLVPNGTGCVTVAGPLRVDGQECVFGTATIDGLQIGDNSIESLATNGPLNLISNGTGKINFLGQIRYVNVNVPSTSIGQYGDETGDVCVDETYIYYCTADYDGSSDIWKRIQWSGDTW